MPTISAFYGILIRMFSMTTRRHIFMLGMASSKATIEIATLNILEGGLPARALNLVSGMDDDA
jgi:hypothetical protein